MNGIEFLTGPVAQAIGWALLHLLWQGAIVAGILAATLGLLSRQSANVRYAVACAALVLMLALGVATAWRAYEPLAAAAAPQQSSMSALAPATTNELAAAPATPRWRERAAELTLSARAWLPQIVLAWLVGVLLLSVRLIFTLRRAHQLAQNDTVSAGEEWQLAVAKLADALQLRRTVKLLESSAVDVPTVIGWMRPVVLLPASTLVGLSPTQLEMILAHELAHIRRHDFFVNLLQAVVETLMFYHPAVWWMSRQVRIERENCCDDLAVSVCGNAIQYARALARLEELRMTPMQATLAANGGSLLDRVRRLVGARTETTVGAPRWAAALAVLSILLLVVAAPSLPALEKRSETKAQEAGTNIDVAASADDQDDSDDPKAVAVAVTPEPDDDDDIELEDDFDIDDFAIPAVAPVVVVTPYPPYPPHTPAVPAPMAVPMVAPTPYPAIAPLPPRIGNVAGRVAAAVAPRAVEAALAGMNFDIDMDFDDDTPKPAKEKSKRQSDRKVGDGELTVDELISFRVHGITPEYINQMRGIFPDLTINEVVSFKIHGVAPAFVTEMRGAGLGTLDAGDFLSLKIHDVSPSYITAMRGAGLGTLGMRQLLSLKIHGVTPDYVKEVRNNFGSNLDVNEILSLKIHNLTPSYMNEMRGAGLGTLTTKELLSMRIHDVDARYVQSLREAGVKINDARDVTTLKIHDVTPEFVRQLSRAGYTNLSAREIGRLAAAGVNEDFIRDMAKYRVKN